MSIPVIQIENVSKAYRLGQADVKHAMFRDALLGALKAPLRRWKQLRDPGVDEDLYWALRDVSLNVGQGEVVGIIGRNGAGKCTLLKILSRITEPTEGRVTLRGRVARCSRSAPDFIRSSPAARMSISTAPSSA